MLSSKQGEEMDIEKQSTKNLKPKLFFSIAHYTSSIDEFTKAWVQPQDFFFKSETQNSVTLIQW